MKLSINNTMTGFCDSILFFTTEHVSDKSVIRLPSGKDIVFEMFKVTVGKSMLHVYLHPARVILSIMLCWQDKTCVLKVYKVSRRNFQHLSEGVASEFDFIYFTTDSTFTSGHRLKESVDSLRKSEDIFIGDVANACPIASGILFSQKLFSKIVSIIDDSCEMNEHEGTGWITFCIQSRTNGNLFIYDKSDWSFLCKFKSLSWHI